MNSKLFLAMLCNLGGGLLVFNSNTTLLGQLTGLMWMILGVVLLCSSLTTKEKDK